MKGVGGAERGSQLGWDNLENTERSMWDSPSAHFYFRKDRVQRASDGMFGTVKETHNLSATIKWDDGKTEEIEQLLPGVTLVCEEKS